MQRLPKPLRMALPLLITAATITVFGYFFIKHPELGHTLRSTNPWILLVVLAMYGVFIVCLAWIYEITLRICSKQLSHQENFQLTSYSTIVNFFGPLQSGPGVRAAYLKQKHQVKLRDYTIATLMYYGFYAVISALFLFLGSQFWWAALPAALIVSGVSYLVIRTVLRRGLSKGGSSNLQLQPQLLAQLFLATFCQLAVLVAIYFVELRAVHTHATIRQAITYGGAANFSLFVSLTPGAIGFREAFLEFSRRLHHISTTAILAASVIDRAVYLVYLGILFLLVISLHVKDRLGMNQSSTPTKTND